MAAFSFHGEITLAGVDFPGNWHGSRLAKAAGLPNPLLPEESARPGCALLAGSAFEVDAAQANGKVARGRKGREAEGAPESEMLAAVDPLLQRAMPSERKPAER